MEFWNAITHFADTGYDGLNPRFRGFLERYGIGAGDWDVIRATPRTEHLDTSWILPDAIEDRAVRAKIVEGVMTELDYAVSTGGIRQRSAMAPGRPGELPHEIMRTAGQFLLFPITVTARHAGRAWSLPSVRAKAGYAGAFLISTTIMGAMSEQLSQLARMKDPRPMDDRKFWLKAVSRGGALGYYGDILEHGIAENGRGLESMANAPVLGSLDNWSNLLVRQPYIALTKPTKPNGETMEPKWARAFERIARYEIPGDNIWYTRGAYERLVLDQLAELGDEHPGESYRRMNRRAQEEGTAYFVPPGAGLNGARSPDWANALGNDGQP